MEMLCVKNEDFHIVAVALQNNIHVRANSIGNNFGIGFRRTLAGHCVSNSNYEVSLWLIVSPHANIFHYEWSQNETLHLLD
jgi:hypothetical protein